MSARAVLPDCTSGPPIEFFQELWKPVADRLANQSGGLVLEVRTFSDSERSKAGIWNYWSLPWFQRGISDLGGDPAFQQGWGAFFGVQPRYMAARESGGRDEDVRFATCLFLDFDGKDFAPGDLGKQAALDAVDQLPIQPSAVIDSGGGYHVYFFLDEPWEFGNKDVHAEVIYGMAVEFGADLAVRNASRVLRIPGTYHLKDPDNPRLVRIIRWSPERRYSIDEFLDHREPLPTTKTTVEIEFDDAVDRLDLDHLPIHAFYREVIRTGDDPKGTEWRRGKTLDRSRRDFSVVLALLRREISPSVIRAIFTHYAVGDKYHDEGDRYLKRTIESARGLLGDQRGEAVAEKKNGWELPAPLEAGRKVPFPVEALSPWHRDWVQAVAASSQTPVDLAACLSFGAVACAVARVFRIQTQAQHSEPLNLYVLVLLPPGSRKSSVQARATAPIREHEKHLVDVVAADVSESASRRRMLKGRIDEAERIAAKAKAEERSLREEEAIRLQQELDAEEVPTLPQLILDDVTTEKLGSVLASQGGRIALFSSEGGFFGTLAGRYSKGGIPNLDIVLKAHCGDEIRVSRVSRAAEFIERPAMTLAIAAQPAILQMLRENRMFGDRGLLGRISYSLPTNTLGRRKASAPSVPGAVERGYQSSLHSLLRLSPTRDQSGDDLERMLILEPEARQVLDGHFELIEPMLSELGEMGHMTDWGGKLVGLAGRLAGLLHLTDHVGMPDPEHVDVAPETMRRAVQIAEYFRQHAMAAYGEMGQEEDLADAIFVTHWLLGKGLRKFSEREVHRSTRNGRFKEKVRLTAALQVLVEYGHIRPIETSGQGTPGRNKSPEYEVNPIWLAAMLKSDQSLGESHFGHFGHESQGEPSSKAQSEGDSDHFGHFGHESPEAIQSPSSPDPESQLPENRAQNAQNGQPAGPEDAPCDEEEAA